MDIKLRFAHARIVAEQYQDFREFCEDGMVQLGFELTEVQADIAEFMQSGPRLRMVMAQRGEAKSTIAALYAVWRLVQRCNDRILIISGGETQASEVARLVIQLIMHWPILEYLRPDRSAGDRTSIEGFDVHYSLKGVEKSPSVACIGITAQLQGKRADVLIADDIETTKNGLSAAQRGQLAILAREFSSICTHGDILYLGTPQTKDSYYNTLSSRGYTVMIWPGRYPTAEELERYDGAVAPFIMQRLQADPSLAFGGGVAGDRGKPTDPERYDEQALIEKELDQGPEGFQLQYMLDTSLADASRQQLKLSNLIIANHGYDQIPEFSTWQTGEHAKVPLPADFPVPRANLYFAGPTKAMFVPTPKAMMYIDPAGGGADEIGIGVSTSIGPYIHVLDVKGLKGGLIDANIECIVKMIREYRVDFIKVESNMGHGSFELALMGALEKAGLGDVGVKGEYSTGQKELRIIQSCVSAMQRHYVVLHQPVFDSDVECGKQHSMDKRKGYSLWYQLDNITPERGSLPHDDRIEAFAGCIRHWKNVLVLDENKAAEERVKQEAIAFLENPMGYTDYVIKNARGARALVQNRRKRY